MQNSDDTDVIVGQWPEEDIMSFILAINRVVFYFSGDFSVWQVEDARIALCRRVAACGRAGLLYIFLPALRPRSLQCIPRFHLAVYLRKGKVDKKAL